MCKIFPSINCNILIIKFQLLPGINVIKRFTITIFIILKGSFTSPIFPIVNLSGSDTITYQLQKIFPRNFAWYDFPKRNITPILGMVFIPTPMVKPCKGITLFLFCQFNWASCPCSIFYGFKEFGWTVFGQIV